MGREKDSSKQHKRDRGRGGRWNKRDGERERQAQNNTRETEAGVVGGIRGMGRERETGSNHHKRDRGRGGGWNKRDGERERLLKTAQERPGYGWREE